MDIRKLDYSLKTAEDRKKLVEQALYYFLYFIKNTIFY